MHTCAFAPLLVLMLAGLVSEQHSVQTHQRGERKLNICIYIYIYICVYVCIYVSNIYIICLKCYFFFFFFFFFLLFYLVNSKQTKEVNKKKTQDTLKCVCVGWGVENKKEKSLKKKSGEMSLQTASSTFFGPKTESLMTKETEIYNDKLDGVKRKNVTRASFCLDRDLSPSLPQPQELKKNILVSPSAEVAAVTPAKMTPLIFPKLQFTSEAKTLSTAPCDNFLAANISSSPCFERLRRSAQEDRALRCIKRHAEIKREEELQQRHCVISRNVNMEGYYKTLYRPQFDTASTSIGAELTLGKPTTPSSATNKKSKTPNREKLSFLRDLPLKAPSLHARDVLVGDVEEYFIAYFYKKNPDAFQRKNSKQVNFMRSASCLTSPGGPLGQRKSHSISSCRNKNDMKQKRRRSKNKELLTPKEGAPAANLQMFLSALINAADTKGIISREAVIAAFRRLPFEVQDTDALETFFSIVRSASLLRDVCDNDNERRLNTSSSTSAVITRGQKARCSLYPSTGPELSAPLTPNTTNAAHLTGSKRTARCASGSQFNNSANNNNRRNIASFSQTRGTFNSITAVGDTTENVSSPVVLIKEILAAIDAVINDGALRETVRLLCFNTLESDGFIHKTLLHTYRLTRRENCEDRQTAIVTPTIIKALGDIMEALRQEEEVEFLYKQMKGKRRKQKGKVASALPAHQKSAIPLNMMRRSHINFTEFSRFFDESPVLSAAFAHVWLPALFALKWPPVRKAVGCGCCGVHGSLEEEEEERVSNVSCQPQSAAMGEQETAGLNGAKLLSLAQRRTAARRIILERLEEMKPASAEPDTESLH